MSYIKREIGFTYICHVSLSLCLFLFLDVCIFSSLEFICSGFILSDWWQIAWYVKFPCLPFFFVHNVFFLFFLYLFLSLVKLNSLFRNNLWIQTIFAYPPFELLKFGYSLVVFSFFCKLSIVFFCFVRDLFLLYCVFAIILWSCWLRLLFVWYFRLFCLGILLSFFRLHLIVVLNVFLKYLQPKHVRN